MALVLLFPVLSRRNEPSEGFGRKRPRSIGLILGALLIEEVGGRDALEKLKTQIHGSHGSKLLPGIGGLSEK